MKYKHAENGTAAYHWCRSVTSGSSGSFCIVHTNGSANSNAAHYSWGVAPGFTV